MESATKAREFPEPLIRSIARDLAMQSETERAGLLMTQRFTHAAQHAGLVAYFLAKDPRITPFDRAPELHEIKAAIGGGYLEVASRFVY
jgi:hypothetical protein